MGDETRCRLRIGGQVSEGKALLEATELLFRGEPPLSVPLTLITRVEAVEGVLRVAWPDGEVELELGEKAEQWAKKIRSPRGWLDRLGVKPGQRVSVVGVEDEDFLAELKARAADFTGEPREESDHLVLQAETRGGLKRVASLKDYLKPSGALWIIRPKGTKEITEGDVMAAGKAAGLVDVKVVALSDTHIAEKFVIPVKKR